MKTFVIMVLLCWISLGTAFSQSFYCDIRVSNGYGSNVLVVVNPPTTSGIILSCPVGETIFRDVLISGGAGIYFLTDDGLFNSLLVSSSGVTNSCEIDAVLAAYQSGGFGYGYGTCVIQPLHSLDQWPMVDNAWLTAGFATTFGLAAVAWVLGQVFKTEGVVS